MRIRVARPTAKMEEVRAFYGDKLELDLLSSFSDHSGYTGLIFGIPLTEVELEFISTKDKKACKPPSNENLVVWYFDNPLEWEKKIEALEKQGLADVKPDNIWWEGRAKTYEDPEGWRIVISKRN